jgi:carbamoyltransferase
MEYFDYATGLRMCNDEKWEALFRVSKREPESELTQPYMDMALAIQQVTEEIILRLAQTAVELTGIRNMVMAGGVALNCVANGKLLRSGIIDDLWIQPAAGDAGGAVGAALAVHFIGNKAARRVNEDRSDQMQPMSQVPGYYNIFHRL